MIKVKIDLRGRRWTARQIGRVLLGELLSHPGLALDVRAYAKLEDDSVIRREFRLDLSAEFPEVEAARHLAGEFERAAAAAVEPFLKGPSAAELTRVIAEGLGVDDVTVEVTCPYPSRDRGPLFSDWGIGNVLVHADGRECNFPFCYNPDPAKFGKTIVDHFKNGGGVRTKGVTED